MISYLIVFLFTFTIFSTIAYFEFFHSSQCNLKIFPRAVFLDMIAASFVIGFFWPIILVLWLYLVVVDAFNAKD